MASSETEVVLYDYWRSSAAYRVRIALGLLGRPYRTQVVDLLKGGHRGAEYMALNPQGLVPSLQIDGQVLTQSLAIIEYLHATNDGSTLLPEDPAGQYRVRQLSYAIAMEIHPVCNLSVASHVAELTGGGDATKIAWMQRFIGKGLTGLEGLLSDGSAGRFCHGVTPSMADCCLIPQLYNADRWGVDVSGMARISAISGACAELPAFQAAHPDAVDHTKD